MAKKVQFSIAVMIGKSGWGKTGKNSKYVQDLLNKVYSKGEILKTVLFYPKRKIKRMIIV